MRSFVACLLLCCVAPLIALAVPVNINPADAATLDRALKGVGPARAEAIVAYRKTHGPFKSIEELALVEGIGRKVIDQERIRGIGETPLEAAAVYAVNDEGLIAAVWFFNAD